MVFFLGFFVHGTGMYPVISQSVENGHGDMGHVPQLCFLLPALVTWFQRLAVDRDK